MAVGAVLTLGKVTAGNAVVACVPFPAPPIVIARVCGLSVTGSTTVCIVDMLATVAALVGGAITCCVGVFFAVVTPVAAVVLSERAL